MTHVYIVTVMPFYETLQILGVYSELDKAKVAFDEIKKFFSDVRGDFVFTIIKAPIDYAWDIDLIRFYSHNVPPFMEIIAEDWKED